MGVDRNGNRFFPGHRKETDSVGAAPDLTREIYKRMSFPHLVHLVVCCGLGHEGLDSERVLRDYAQAIPKLKARYQEVRGNGVFVQETAAGEPNEVILTRHLSFAQKGELWKMSTIGLNELTKKGPHETVRVWNAKSAFKFHRTAEGAPPSD